MRLTRGGERGWARRAALGDWGERVPKRPLKRHGPLPGAFPKRTVVEPELGKGSERLYTWKGPHRGTVAGPAELQEPRSDPTESSVT